MQIDDTSVPTKYELDIPSEGYKIMKIETVFTPEEGQEVTVSDMVVKGCIETGEIIESFMIFLLWAMSLKMLIYQFVGNFSSGTTTGLPGTTLSLPGTTSAPGTTGGFSATTTLMPSTTGIPGTTTQGLPGTTTGLPGTTTGPVGTTATTPSILSFPFIFE